MARKATGQLYINRSKITGEITSFGVRFRYGGRRRYVSLDQATTEREAREAMAHLMADVQRGLWTAPEDREPEPRQRTMPTFGEFASDWYRGRCVEAGWCDDETDGPIEKFRPDDYWRLRHLAPLASLRLDEINAETVDRYRQKKIREGALSKSTINKMISTLATILEMAVDYDLIARNPAAGRKRRCDADAPKRVFLNRSEHIEALVEGAATLDRKEGRRTPPWRRALIATLVYAGLRIDEALSLRWDQLDLANGLIRLKGTKTAAAERDIQILPVLRDVLTEYAASLDAGSRTGLVFATTSCGKRYAGGKKHSASNIRTRVLAPAVDEANDVLARRDVPALPDGLTPHGLRRTYASLLVALGRDPAVVKHQMGHTTAAFTLGIYAAAMCSAEGERDRLRALVNGANGQEADKPQTKMVAQRREEVTP